MEMQAEGRQDLRVPALTEKEKQTLRLIVRGYDAKSMARHLGLSVHTVNERLRDARRKMAVSSSREAARILHETEGAHPESFGDKGLGEAATAGAGQTGGDRKAGIGPAWIAGGILAMSLLAAALLIAAQSSSAPPAAAAHQTAETPVFSAARAWLAMVDAGRWEDSRAAAGASFRSGNTLANWRDASLKVRVPLGAVESRRALDQRSVPAPPNGYEMVRFRTRFAARGTLIETLSLAREDGQWRVVGYYLEDENAPAPAG